MSSFFTSPADALCPLFLRPRFLSPLFPIDLTLITFLLFVICAPAALPTSNPLCPLPSVPCSDVWVALITFLYLDFLDATSTMFTMARLVDEQVPGFINEKGVWPRQLQTMGRRAPPPPPHVPVRAHTHHWLQGAEGRAGRLCGG